MTDKTSIEWTDATWNPIRARNRATGGMGHYCAHVSEGCRNCYSEAFQPRFKNPIRFAAQDLAKVEIFLDEDTLTQPLRWKRPRKIFVCSMTDLFGDWVTDDMLDRIFAVMALCPQHTFQVLTKRPHRMRDYFDNREMPKRVGDLMEAEPENRVGWYAPCSDGKQGWLEVCMPIPNVWFGVSVEDQKAADEYIPILRDTPAVIRFLSAEPLLGPITPDLAGIDWVIAGGESGRRARPMHPDWARSLRDQCAAAGIPFMFKQWGQWAQVDWDEDSEFDDTTEVVGIDPEIARHDCAFDEASATLMAKVGKKAAGRTLDGRTHDEFPRVAP